MYAMKLRQTCHILMKKVLLLQETEDEDENEEGEDKEEDDDETDDENDEEYDCGNVRYYTHFDSDAVECLTATQEILVRSSARTKGV